ncbi:hypothetical protein HX773_18005 [Pantoea sp. B9002]|uniref:hypothetical protein n=1 Tax=Pantoea sp. B9002 TaxID=2726979 RepID=UPI00159F8D07|nr:hypothetical protein [Pantoea sp. B9002]NWA62800.1 hypothetical protein [Pantoea sp. B9002]
MKKIVWLWLFITSNIKVRSATYFAVFIAWLMRHDKTYAIAIKLINLFIIVFKRKLNSFYFVSTAEELSSKIIKPEVKLLSSDFLRNKLLTEVIRQYMDRFPWENMSSLVERKSHEVFEKEEELSNLLFFTHTGDYWISILTAIRQYRWKNYKFIVPIYQEIDAASQAMYDKIAYEGVNVTFMHIHAPGALLKLSKHFKDPHCVIAIFYDLSCYIGGIYNGNVEPVSFLGRKGWMTTGILRLASKYRSHANFVCCHYSYEDQFFITQFSQKHSLENTTEMSRLMVAHLEFFLRTWPAQWHFISNLDSYFHFPWSQISTKHTNQIAHYAQLEKKYCPSGE